jgi:putative peptidoglycan lipid II flippase
LTQQRQILKSASVIGFFTLISRVLGYVRDARLTMLLGTSISADAFLLAFRIPNLVRRMLGEGSLNAAFIPVFTDYMEHRTREEMWRLANRVFWTAALLLSVLAILGMTFSSLVVAVYSVRGVAQLHILATHLNRILFLYVFFAGLAAVAIAVLNSFQIFGTPAAAPIAMNVTFILFSLNFLLKRFHSPAEALAASVLVGGIVQFLMQLPQAVRMGMRFDFGISFRDPGVLRVAKLMVPAFFGVGIAHITVLVGTLFATDRRMPVGSLTSLYVSDRIMELVLGVYALAVATAILPMMSRQAAASDIGGLKATLMFALRIVSFITVPAAVGLVVLREPIVQILFERGQFGAESVRLTARALLYFALGLPVFSAVKLIVAAFYSTQDTKTPVLTATAALAANLALNVIFVVWCLRTLQNGAPALAAVLATYLNFALLFALLRRKMGPLGARAVGASLGKACLCAAAMGAACEALLHAVHFQSIVYFLPRLGVFLALLGGGAAVYFGLARILGCRELGELYGLLSRSEHGAPAATSPLA